MRFPQQYLYNFLVPIKNVYIKIYAECITQLKVIWQKNQQKYFLRISLTASLFYTKMYILFHLKNLHSVLFCNEQYKFRSYKYIGKHVQHKARFIRKPTTPTGTAEKTLLSLLEENFL